MTSILITGGAGYIGSILTQHLLWAGHEVTVLDNFMYGQTSLNHLCHDRNLIIVKGDCRDTNIIEELIKKPDVIIPLAAIVGAPACDADTLAAKTVNSFAISILLNRISPNQQVIIPTTNSGYGIGEKGKECTEDSPLKPLSLYGREKVEAEAEVLERARGISLRLATVFGCSPRMRLDLLVNDFVYRAVKDRYVVLFEPHFKRNYIHVRDVALAFIHAIENFEKMKGQVYNVGLSTANLSKQELCESIRTHIPEFTFPISELASDPDKRDYVVSNTKLEATGWRPEYTLDDGIVELIKGYQQYRRPYSNV
jgi:nucleoside-diphosphate-sugar epimerase